MALPRSGSPEACRDGVAVIAFEIRDGKVRRCEDTGPCRRVVLPNLPLPVIHSAPPDKRTRRRWARVGKKNRCGARRISAPQPFPTFPASMTMQCRTEVAHLLRDGSGREALLYLPDGERPTQDHCDRVTRSPWWGCQ